MTIIFCDCGDEAESHDSYYGICLMPGCRCERFTSAIDNRPSALISMIKGLFGGSAIGLIIAMGILAIAVVAIMTLSGHWPSEVDPQYQAPRPAVTPSEWPMQSAIQA